MALRTDAGAAGGVHGHVRLGEGGLELGSIEVADPCSTQTEIVDGHHQMGGDDGSIDIGKVLLVASACLEVTGFFIINRIVDIKY